MTRYKELENKRVLLVEDMELNQFLARHMMESWGCVVEVAENGVVALEKLKQSDFDLILMDIQMPVMDGLEATRQIRLLGDRHKSTIPVVALTANATVEYQTYRDVGMNDCLAKPFEEASLYRTVSRNIRRDMINSKEEGLVDEVAEEMVQPRTGGEKSSPKLYDLSMVEAISGGDPSFVRKMVQLFLDTVPVTLQELRRTCEAGEWMALSKQAHKLKSTIDSMQILLLKQDIRHVENNAKTQQDTGRLTSYVNRIIEVMENVMTEVRKDFEPLG